MSSVATWLPRALLAKGKNHVLANSSLEIFRMFFRYVARRGRGVNLVVSFIASRAARLVWMYTVVSPPSCPHLSGIASRTKTLDITWTMWRLSLLRTDYPFGSFWCVGSSFPLKSSKHQPIRTMPNSLSWKKRVSVINDGTGYFQTTASVLTYRNVRPKIKILTFIISWTILDYDQLRFGLYYYDYVFVFCVNRHRKVNTPLLCLLSFVVANTSFDSCDFTCIFCRWERGSNLFDKRDIQLFKMNLNNIDHEVKDFIILFIYRFNTTLHHRKKLPFWSCTPVLCNGHYYIIFR